MDSTSNSTHMITVEDHPNPDKIAKSSASGDKKSPKGGEASSTIKPSSEAIDKVEHKASKGGPNAEIAQPLAPPPRPAPQTSEAPDYFSTVHNNSHFSLEPNPFEQSFGNPSSETPGKLPSVAALTSPASLTGNTNLGGTYNWSNSLRSGPLSPAMLSGPTVEAGYFDSHLRGSFPTPNESSLRTGLTPGGGGSMFPAPSPNSQALFSHLASGGATPSTLEFHRSAINAAAANRKSDQQAFVNGGSSQAAEQRAQIANMDQPAHQQPGFPHLGQHDNDAANGLFLLAQAGNESQSANQFAVPSQPAQVMRVAPRSSETSPSMMKRGLRNGTATLADSNPTSTRGMSEQSGDMSEANSLSKPNTRAKNKRTPSGKGPANSRRKTEDTAPKQPPNKKAKTRASNSGANIDMNMEEIDTDDEQNIKEEQYQENREDQYNENGRKMTDEEKRKNFLERNRVAALKCRQRKKQWLANLQAKVEIFSSENDALSATVAQLREEILNLKTILISHKDCPIAQTQGVGSFAQHPQGNDYNPHANPYNMAMQNGQQVMAGSRRYS